MNFTNNKKSSNNVFKENKTTLNKQINLICKEVCLFTNARDETNIKEWAAHHLLLGFTKIIIFDHKSKTPLTNIFQNFDKRVKIVNVSHMENPIKIKLMHIAGIIAKSLKFDWMIYLDADEFLILSKKYLGVKHLLSEFNHADALSINWLMFGSNYLKTHHDGLILDNYTRSDLYLNAHVKTFVRPSRIKDVNNPHFYNIQNPNRFIGINNTLIKNNFYKNDIHLTFSQVPAYIAHYVNQSEETFIKRKIQLPRDDRGVMRNFNIDDITNIHNEFNDIENNEPKIKYANNIKSFLEKISNCSAHESSNKLPVTV
jgi:hypothetical protein